MSEMVTKVALAIADKIGPAISGGVILRDVAIAAITAMREPTPEMLLSENIHPSCHMCGGHLEGWHHMIDAALSHHSDPAA